MKFSCTVLPSCLFFTIIIQIFFNESKTRFQEHAGHSHTKKQVIITTVWVKAEVGNLFFGVIRQKSHKDLLAYWNSGDLKEHKTFAPLLGSVFRL